MAHPAFVEARGGTFIMSPCTENSQMGETCHNKYHKALQHIRGLLVHLF